MYFKNLIQKIHPGSNICHLWIFLPLFFSIRASAQCNVYFSSCPSEQTIVDLDNSRDEAITWPEPVSATTGACSDFTMQQTGGPDKGSYLDVPGNYTITYEAEAFDLVTGESSRQVCIFAVRLITDKEPPVFTYCPPNITVYAGDGRHVTGKWALPTATDNSGEIQVKGVKIPCLTEFELGNTSVIYTAQDASGNIAECVFTVTVLPGSPPEQRPAFDDREAMINPELNGFTKQGVAIHEKGAPLSETAIRLLPNPFNNWLVMEAAWPLEMAITVRIFDLNGRLIIEKNWSAGTKQLILNTEEMTPGIVYVKIVSADGAFTNVLRGVKL